MSSTDEGLHHIHLYRKDRPPLHDSGQKSRSKRSFSYRESSNHVNELPRSSAVMMEAYQLQSAAAILSPMSTKSGVPVILWEMVMQVLTKPRNDMGKPKQERQWDT